MGGDPNTPNPELAFYYVSPNGNGIGTSEDPADFGKALLTGKNIYMQDGIYTQDTVSVLASVSLQPVTGARPVVVGSDGYPPTILRGNSSTIKDVWFGGNKATVERSITMADNCITDGCTFWNYYGGIAEGSHVDNLYQNNRFVNCGTGGLNHDIYISGDSRAKIYNNIHIGGQGYKIHLWHDAANTDVQRNFIADCYYELVLPNVTCRAIDNIFWNHTPPVNSWLTVNISQGTFTHNLFGHRTFGTGRWGHDINGETGLTVDRLGLIGDRYTDTTSWPGNSIGVGPYNGDGDVLPGAGTNYTHYALTDLPDLLGYSESQIDAVVAALESAFAQTIQQIHDDGSIEGNFSILRAVVDAWKSQ